MSASCLNSQGSLIQYIVYFVEVAHKCEHGWLGYTERLVVRKTIHRSMSPVFDKRVHPTKRPIKKSGSTKALASGEDLEMVSISINSYSNLVIPGIYFAPAVDYKYLYRDFL